MKMETLVAQPLARPRLSRPACGWMGLWVLASALAWSLAFTFSPPPAYKFTIKILHVLVFLPWSVAAIRSWRGLSGKPGDVRVELGALIAVAALVELSERWLPEHEPDWVGFSCSCLGAVLAVVLVRRSDRWRGRNG